jgi:hypothetical protein
MLKEDKLNDSRLSGREVALLPSWFHAGVRGGVAMRLEMQLRMIDTRGAEKQRGVASSLLPNALIAANRLQCR